ncbi:hypothetical protein HPP92_010089 [Vanilla planifolia]|uniref:Gnk2-homologous domain-containing protein n=1 Tax=Vanilla planifolia TaxID=51239 RepID=A0A835V138_VANPL|nr:hypothetical protein HPP92_010089 [Vanilla planifolia]
MPPPLVLRLFLFLQISLLISTWTTNANEEPVFFQCSDKKYTSGSLNESGLLRLLEDLASSTSNSTQLRSARATRVGGYTIFGFAQCRPDASELACGSCLDTSVSMVLDSAGNGCNRSVSAAVFQNLCFLRYDNRNFTGEVGEKILGGASSILISSDPVAFANRIVDIVETQDIRDGLVYGGPYEHCLLQENKATH